MTDANNEDANNEVETGAFELVSFLPRPDVEEEYLKILDDKELKTVSEDLKRYFWGDFAIYAIGTTNKYQTAKNVVTIKRNGEWTYDHEWESSWAARPTENPQATIHFEDEFGTTIAKVTFGLNVYCHAPHAIKRQYKSPKLPPVGDFDRITSATLLIHRSNVVLCRNP